jgi:MFS family permease
VLCFVIYIAANIGLALQHDYAALLVLRCVQSAGSSGTVALAVGVVADIATSADRGVYVGFSSVGSILGPTLAPIIGGLLSQFLGWKWIFWFLTIFAVAVFVPLMLFFPETGRKVVGDGSVPPPRLNHSLTSLLRERKRTKSGIVFSSEQQEELRKSYRLRFPNPLATLVVATSKLGGLILFSNGLLLASTYAVLIGVPSQFKAIYGFNDLQISLVYIPIGVGSMLSAFTTGKIIDWNYRRHAKLLGRPVVRNRQDDLSNFPIERARLEVALPMLYLGAAGIIIYGWVLHFETNLAGPLTLLFLTGYAIISAFQVLQLLMVDIYPKKPATAAAANNLVRCLLGAGATAVVGPMLNKMGRGWTYTFAALIWAAYSPVLFALMKVGPRWRREMKVKDDEANEKRAKKNELDRTAGNPEAVDTTIRTRKDSREAKEEKSEILGKEEVSKEGREEDFEEHGTFEQSAVRTRIEEDSAISKSQDISTAEA